MQMSVLWTKRQTLLPMPSQVQKPLWRHSLTASERHSEKQILSQLDRKTAYLKNPKLVAYSIAGDSDQISSSDFRKM
jgi:hypothetical protein